MADEKKADYKIGEELEEREKKTKETIREAGKKSEPIVATHWTLKSAAGAALKEDKKKKNKGKAKVMETVDIHVKKGDKGKQSKDDK